MAKVLDKPKPVTYQITDEAEVERFYLELCHRFEKHRIEIINGRIVVRELPTIDHSRIIFRLMSLLMHFAATRKWEVLPEAKIFLHAQTDRYEPDVIVIPSNARLWDPSHVYADSTLLIVEVVSPSSVQDDHVVKPRACAIAGAPLYLVIDTFDGIARLFSEPAETGYQNQIEAPLGKPLTLPEPWDLTIDTGQLIEG
jgi:Uma2 family endonuclease